MAQQGRLAAGIAGLAALAAVAAGCGDDDIEFSATPTATATATATATRTPTVQAVAQVAGLIVVAREVGSGPSDGLNPLPPETLPSVGTGFDRGLGNAEWAVGDGTLHGTTSDDGRFSITGLTPGRHIVRVTKTVDGNLLELAVPIIVGDDGAAEVVAEVSWGLVRATSTYTLAGAVQRAVFAPNGAHLVARGGQLLELGDGVRTLVDSDGDGRFDPRRGGCEPLYACDASGGCGDPERICVCIPSCPLCTDCPQHACVARSYFHTPECGPDGLCKPFPYACGESGSCAQMEDSCACIASCPACDDCPSGACVAPCTSDAPIDLTGVDVYGPSRLVVGQRSGASAVARLSDGTAVDVTWLATWTASAPAVATVDSWGAIAPLAAGESDLTAALGALTGPALHLEVVERPTLQRIYLENSSCYFYDYPRPGDPALPPTGPPVDESGAFLPPPDCQRIVRIGTTLQFRAIGEFDTGYYDDITDEVEWRLEPSDVGSVAQGVFTAVAAGATQLRAALAGVQSDAVDIRVVSQPTVVSLSIYAAQLASYAADGGPVRPGADAPCFECGYVITLLRGDTVTLAATAHYDTGEWEDVSDRVTWRTSDGAVATVDANGTLTAAGAGDALVDAQLATVTSAGITLRVVNEATLQSLFIYQDGQDRALGVGGEAVFHAIGYYDVGFQRDLTDEVTWQSSDPAVGGFDSPGIFTGRAAGTVTVTAALGEQQSAPLPLEVYATSELAYCDPAAVNRGTWSDDFNRVTLESDCAAYTPPDVVELRFTVTEMQRPGGIFDPCLDLYAYRGEQLVRTIREEGCGDPFLAAGAPGRDEAELRYQLKAFWDLKDESGQTVEPGTYTVRGRFYLYYDPIVEIDVTVSPATPAG